MAVSLSNSLYLVVTDTVVATGGVWLTAAARLLGEGQPTIFHEDNFTDRDGGRLRRFLADRRCAASWRATAQTSI